MTPASRYARALGLLLFVAALSVVCTDGYNRNPLDPNQNWYKPYDFLSFNVEDDNYMNFMHNGILNVLVSHCSRNLIGQSTWVLHRQNINNVPFRWLILELVGAGDNRVMVAIRQDNIYVTGFTDKEGTWYVFSNARHLIPVATVYRFADDYGSLIGGYRSLYNVRVGKQTTLDAVEYIANFAARNREDADVGYVARALAIVAATFAEGTRFSDFTELIAHNWEAGADLHRLSDLVVKWRVLSCALMISVQEHGSWNSKEARDLSQNNGIHTINDALGVLQIALWPWRERCSKTITWLT